MELFSENYKAAKLTPCGKKVEGLRFKVVE